MGWPTASGSSVAEVNHLLRAGASREVDRGAEGAPSPVLRKETSARRSDTVGGAVQPVRAWRLCRTPPRAPRAGQPPVARRPMQMPFVPCAGRGVAPEGGSAISPRRDSRARPQPSRPMRLTASQGGRCGPTGYLTARDRRAAGSCSRRARTALRTGRTAAGPPAPVRGPTCLGGEHWAVMRLHVADGGAGRGGAGCCAEGRDRRQPALVRQARRRRGRERSLQRPGGVLSSKHGDGSRTRPIGPSARAAGRTDCCARNSARPPRPPRGQGPARPRPSSPRTAPRPTCGSSTGSRERPHPSPSLAAAPRSRSRR